MIIIVTNVKNNDVQLWYKDWHFCPNLKLLIPSSLAKAEGNVSFLSKQNSMDTHTQNALPFYSKSLKEFYLKPFAFGKLRRKYVIGYLLSWEK